MLAAAVARSSGSVSVQWGFSRGWLAWTTAAAATAWPDDGDHGFVGDLQQLGAGYAFLFEVAQQTDDDGAVSLLGLVCCVEHGFGGILEGDVPGGLHGLCGGIRGRFDAVGEEQPIIWSEFPAAFWGLGCSLDMPAFGPRTAFPGVLGAWLDFTQKLGEI